MKNCAFDEKCRLILLDPGLTHSSGHHFSSAELLLERLSHVAKKSPLTILGGVGEWKEKLSSKKYADLTIKEHFCSNFYHFYSGIESLVRINSYVSKLSVEYEKAILQEIAIENAPRLFLSHTLDWEHLIALSYAIKAVQQKTPSKSLKFISCMMYSMGTDHLGNIIDRKKYLVSRTALRLARSVSGLYVYASHFELMQAINQVENRFREVKCSPSFIADWNATNKSNKKTNRSKNILLYAGDAKEIKGFHLLPDLIKSILGNLKKGINLVIQFTCAEQTHSNLGSAAAQLVLLAQRNPQITLITEYMSDDKLASLLSDTDMFLFNYSAQHYENTSSGFLWHLVWHGVPFVTFDHSWITREAERLGANFCVIEKNKFGEFIHSLNTNPPIQPCVPSIEDSQLGYRHTLFQEPIEWLSNEWAKFDE
jgi:hypothetical protein